MEAAILYADHVTEIPETDWLIRVGRFSWPEVFNAHFTYNSLSTVRPIIKSGHQLIVLSCLRIQGFVPTYSKDGKRGEKKKNKDHC